MSRSSRRGQVEPLAALVVLLAVTGAVTTYAAALDGVGREADRDLATPTLDRVASALGTGGVADPNRTRRAHRAGPSGYRLNVTVAAAGRRWTAGPAPPRDGRADAASRSIGVRLEPGRVRPGRLRVEVWT
ncbi:DUF7285 family protein [Haloplanus halophilus]|uniref:DUF7285 family protein n=1 Tax=Haloplanus halophilus TaxID=2949993 RepID=UPI00203D0AA8|nr:hypothetical protein [Haloplanus sp. GDY1]